MTLKKMLVLATFCLTQTLNATEIDPFFTDSNTTNTIQLFYGPEGGRQARVVGQAGEEIKAIARPVLFTEERGWRHNDAKLQSNRILFGAVEVGNELVQQEAPFQAPVDYKNNGITEGSQEELVPGKTVFVYKIQNYERPDGTIYQKFIEALHRLRMEEQREELVDIRVTTNSKEYFRTRGLKSRMATRYTMQDHGQTKVQYSVTQLDLTDDTPVAEPTITKTFFELRPKGSYESNDNEGQPYPTNYKIVN